MSVTFQLQRIRKKKKKRKGMDKMNTESDQTKPVKEKKSVVENDERTVVTTKTTTIRVVTLKFLWHFTFLSLIIENFNEKHRIYSKFISLRSNKKKPFSHDVANCRSTFEILSTNRNRFSCINGASF